MAIDVTKESRKIIETLIEKIKSDNEVKEDEYANVDRLEKKRKEIWNKYNEFHSRYKREGLAQATYNKGKTEYLRAMEEIDLEGVAKKYDIHRRKNFVNRLKLIKILIMFEKDKMTYENVSYSFENAYRSFMNLVKEDAIKELCDKQKLEIEELKFNQNYNLTTTDSKYYLSKEQKDKLLVDVTEIPSLIDKIKADDLSTLDTENISMYDLLKDNAYDVYSSIKKSELKEKNTK